MWRTEIPQGSEPLGYQALVEMFDIKAFPHYRSSYVFTEWKKKEITFNSQHLTLHLYPPPYRLSKDPFEHIEFALKYEGFHLPILHTVLKQLTTSDVTDFVKKTPTGKYSRVVWFLYEKLTEQFLDIPDCTRGSYIPLLDPNLYYCGAPRNSSRHRVADNLLGSLTFCPLVRKTHLLQQYEAKRLDQVAQRLTHQYDPQLLERAMRYLYTKETISSWEIEREKPDKARLAKFTSLLQKADTFGHLSEELLVELQKNIVDFRFASNGYRDFQNYVGEEPSLEQLIIHYIPPKPEDLSILMKGLLEAYDRMEFSTISPVIVAAVLSFGFVFLHPFLDGNGRTHRFLIHYVLSRSHFSTPGIVFPISATILKEPRKYNETLELFSKPLLEYITNYHLDDFGNMRVLQDTKDWYSFFDYTPFAEYLFDCVERTITTEFHAELQFLQNYDRIKIGIKNIVDIPDQLLDLFIRCVRQNGGKLSTRKREQYFSMLTECEIKDMEQIILGTCRVQNL